MGLNISLCMIELVELQSDLNEICDQVARQVLQSTSSYKKVALLITDGKSNVGGSPIAFAEKMRLFQQLYLHIMYTVVYNFLVITVRSRYLWYVVRVCIELSCKVLIYR